MKREKPTVVAIAGGSAAGKTTLTEEIVDSADDAIHVSMDAFYQDVSYMDDEEMVEANFDHPRWLLWGKLKSFLRAVVGGRKIIWKPTYDFETGETGEEPIRVPEIVVIEGLWALHSSVRKHADICVYVDADPDTRLIRRIERDVEERGFDAEEVVRDFKENVKPMHEDHVEPTREHADIIVNGGFQDVAVDAVLGAAEKHRET